MRLKTAVASSLFGITNQNHRVLLLLENDEGYLKVKDFETFERSSNMLNRTLPPDDRTECIETHRRTSECKS